ncbi:transcription factor with AP2 domain(s), putative [Plasmodium knowlesi strain H]|uniref:Transcription factor with AP2 domain(S), putative n=3 Tax=Plasmodium knowlesi TaxID=5850 RepID=A0A5K1VIE3_PLAKH|nr:AP2 domain transcription factor, putative [Plasmodium knowlesi strain H]OTN67198.1 putative Transcription factor with AP2 domain(S) [Plasmodium knowlesi]CAA9988660.1 AP2 domain transcription factor, putative [Plasmodium knowlesi strain H]SBO21542.1 transcription factor with AP2 domain(s), putative [Plasmodium knowlesi strain H]SBO21934.1 transcription factor with AP2 domain(s), putative [Plasmodium knowlesi strain H]VVS78134.1 AP2 domain transcription factor, putative [Plasmodium knowlesi s|eukprot:XP_002259637.1 hypothetical protein, conserved in Plasmodium species [Plasmodium knowlesi strain H]
MKIVAIDKGEITPISNANEDPTGVCHESPSPGYNTDDINEHINDCEKPEGVCSRLGNKILNDSSVNVLRNKGVHGEKENSCVFSNIGEGTPVGGDKYVHRPQNNTGCLHTGECDIEKETKRIRRGNSLWGRGRNETPSSWYQRSENAENTENAESLPCAHSNCSVKKKNNFPNDDNSRLVKPPIGDLPNRGGKCTSKGNDGTDGNTYRPRSWKGGRPHCSFPSHVDELPRRKGRGKEEEGEGKGKIPQAYEEESTAHGINCLPLPDSTTGNGKSESKRSRAISYHRENAKEGENRLQRKKNGPSSSSSTLIGTKGGRVQERSENGKKLTQVGPRSIDKLENPLERDHGEYLLRRDAITAECAVHGKGKSNVKRERLFVNKQKDEVMMGSATYDRGEGPIWNGNEKLEEDKRRKRGRWVENEKKVCMGGEKNESLKDTHTRDKKEEESSPVRSLLVFDEITNTWNILWKCGSVSIIKSYSIDVGGSASRHVAMNDLQSINNLYSEVSTGGDYISPENTWELMKWKIYKKFGEKYFFIGKDYDWMNGRMSGEKNKTKELEQDKSGVGVESIGDIVSKMWRKLREAHDDGNRVKCEQNCSMGYGTKDECGEIFNIERKSVIPFGQSSEDPSLKCEKERKIKKGEETGKRGRSNERGTDRRKEGTVQVTDTEGIRRQQSKGKEELIWKSLTVQASTPNAEERRELLRRRHENKLKEQLARRERKLRREEEKVRKIKMKEEKKRIREEKKKMKEQERIKMREEKVNLRKMRKLEKWQNIERMRRWKKMKKLEKMEKLGRLGRRERIEEQEKLERQGRLDRTEGLGPMGKLAQLDSVDSVEKLESLKNIIAERKMNKVNCFASKINSSPGKEEGSWPEGSSELGEAHCTPDFITNVVKISLEDEEKRRLFLEKKQKVLKVMRKNVLVQGKVYLDVGYGDNTSGDEEGDEWQELGDSSSTGNAGSWVVSWVLYGRTCRKKFPIEDYGFEEARQMAEEYKRDRVNFILNNFSEYDTYVREALNNDSEEGGAVGAYKDDRCTVMANQEQLHHEELIEFCCELLKNPVSEEHWKNKVKWVQNKKSWNIEIVKKEQNKFIREKIYYSEEKYGYIIGKCIAVYDYLNAEHKLLKNYFDVNVANLQYDSKRHAWKISRYVPNQLNKKNYYFDVGVYGWMYSRKLGLLLAIYLNTRRPVKSDEDMLTRSCSFVRHLQDDSIERRKYLFPENTMGQDHFKNVEPKFPDDVMMKGVDLPAPLLERDPCTEKSVKYFHANVVVEEASKEWMKENEVSSSCDGTVEGGSPSNRIVANTGEEDERGYRNAPGGPLEGASEDSPPMEMDEWNRGEDSLDRRDEEVKRGRKRKKKAKGEEEKFSNWATDDEDTTNKRRHSQNEEEKIKNKTMRQSGSDLKKLYEMVHNRKYCQLKEMHTCGEKELLNFLSNENDRALFLMEDIHIQGEDEHYLVNILENYYYYNLCRKMLKVRKKLSM